MSDLSATSQLGEAPPRRLEYLASASAVDHHPVQEWCCLNLPVPIAVCSL
jgi:hypothetical protein